MIDKNDCAENKISDSKTFITCLNCGKEKETYKCHLKKDDTAGKFCSRKCKEEYKKKTKWKTINCINCGKEKRVILSSELKFCCGKCANEYAQNRIYTNCGICGREFYYLPSRTRKYCSVECAGIGRRKGWSTNCIICGNEFWVYASRPDKKYCSRKCQSVDFRGENHPRFKEKINIKCELCGIEFSINEKELGEVKYCSIKCRNESRIGKYIGNKSPVYSRVERTCPICGTVFTVKKSQNKRSVDICCCREHAIIWSSISGKFNGHNNPMYGKSGELCPAWNGGKSFEPYSPEFTKSLKSKIKKNFNNCCQICGEYYNSNELDIHHADYNKLNNNEDNLFPLCKKCHGKTLWNRNCWVEYFDIKI